MNSKLRSLGLAGLFALFPASTGAQAPLRFAELHRHDLRSAGATQIVLCDLDLDGDLDVLAAGFSRGFSGAQLHANDGNGSFSQMATLAPSEAATSIACGDVDGDGDPDVILGLIHTRDRLYLNDGSGSLTDVTTTHLPGIDGPTSCLALGDVDGDGDMDLMAGGSRYILNNSYSPNRLLLNGGNGVFTDVTNAQLPGNLPLVASIAMGDVDGDGDVDLLCAHQPYSGTPPPSLLINDGSGTFTDASGARLPRRDPAMGVAMGNFDGDGHIDIMYGVWGSQDNLYINDGRGFFVDRTSTHMPPDTAFTNSIACADVDGDGDTDVLIGDYQRPNGSPSGRLYINDGAGGFTDSTTAQLPRALSFAFAPTCADLDNDGDLDAVFADQPNGLLFNLRRQLHAPAAPRIGHPYTLDAYLRYGPQASSEVAAVLLSAAPASIPLPPFGTLGIDPALSQALPLLTIPQPAGVGTVTINVPNDTGLVGQPVYSQALIASYPSDLRLSNVVSDVIQ